MATQPAKDAGPFLDEIADLSLSTWMGISGAAISTGLGQNTSLGLSLLAGLSNLRLGVWWLPPQRRGWKRLLPWNWVQAYLLREFLAKFAGPEKRKPYIARTRRDDGADWRGRLPKAILNVRKPGPDRVYLTDGGHFENSGVYELVRRRVPFIIACDNGADPDYRFEDVVNLTRKLRIDFDAALEFLPKDKLDLLLGEEAPNRGIFGEISELIGFSQESRSQGPYAAIARIRMPAKCGLDEYLGTLILLKPRLSGLEMIDLLDYNHLNPSFPQQSTGDQFFDEAQWESYFRLGEHIAGLVFAAFPGDNWSPRRLQPISKADHPWFGKDWAAAPSSSAHGEKGKDCPRSAGAATAAAAPAERGATVRVGGLGFGQLLTAGIASLGALGATLGISQSLTTTAIEQLSSSSDASVTMKIDDETSRMLSGGVAVHLDPEVIDRLDAMLGKLDLLIAPKSGPGPGGGTDGGTDSGPSGAGGDSVVVELQSIRSLLASFIAMGNDATLRRLLTEVRGLRADIRARDLGLRNQLSQLDSSLNEIKKAVDDGTAATTGVGDAVKAASPRRNARSGQ